MNIKNMYIDKLENLEGKTIVNTGYISSDEKIYLIFNDNTFTIIEGQTRYDCDETDIAPYNHYTMSENLKTYNYELAHALGQHTNFDYDKYKTTLEEEKQRKIIEELKVKEDREYQQFLQLQEKFKNKTQ